MFFETFTYDYKSYEHISIGLDKKYFFNIIEEVECPPEYKNNDGYTYYKYLNDADQEGYEKKQDFDYRLNSDEFRSSNFSKLSLDNFDILALGCSYTFGYGLPEEFTWASLLKDKIGLKEKNTNLINLGSPGLGIDSIINNAISYIKQYGIPNAIVALFPDINRHMVYDSESKRYNTFTPGTLYLEHKKLMPTRTQRTIRYVPEDIIYSVVNQIRMFEELCKGYGIRLLWTSWYGGNEKKIYDGLDFENYFCYQPFNATPINALKNNIPKKYEHLSEMARDNNHPGIAYNIHMAREFLKEWENV